MEATRSCLICTATITIGHAGIDACRACATFYKRAVLSGKRYPCRQGNGTCEFRKHQRFACRSCRFDRCARLGMLLESPGKAVLSESVSIVDEPATNVIAKSDDNSTDPLLNKILMEYRASCDRRRVQELHFAKVFGLKKSHHKSEEYFISNVRHNFECYRILVTESLPLIRIIFPKFDEFSIADKISLFKCFIKFSVVESYYLTQRDWRNTSYFVVSLITCSDLANASEWVTDGDKVQRKDDLVRFLIKYTTEYTTFLISIRKSEAISEMEYCALIALAFCDLDATQIVPEHLLKDAEVFRSIVFDELYRYYRKDLKLVDYSGKLGRLMTMFHTMSEASTVLAEELRMYSYLFGVYASDEVVRDIFIQ